MDLFGQTDARMAADVRLYAQVALEQGIDAELTYTVPAAMPDPAVGDRVVVPLGRGNKEATGFVTSLADHSEVTRVKPILRRDDHAVTLTAELIALARWMADYYCCPLGMVLLAMLPAAVKHGTGSVTRTVVRLSDAPPPTDKAEQGASPPRLTRLQRQVLEAAERLAAEGRTRLELRDLADAAGAKTVGPVRQLLAKGFLIAEAVDDVQARQMPTAEAVSLPPARLNDAQRQVVDALCGRMDAGFAVNLLFGVTGSGKTEVYLQVIEHILSRRRQAGEAIGAMVLVPEIALTPQAVARFRSRFDRVAVMHSGLTAAQRHEQWRRIHRGEADIVVGARSAVFAPLPRLGLVIIDEEQETSYKQDQLPRYHARDVAIKRAQLAGAPVVLGSATPSLEAWWNCQPPAAEPAHTVPSPPRPHWHLLRLPQRVAGYRLPRVEIVDLVAERRERRGIHLLSRRMEAALRRTLDAGGQAILLLNRRGYANYIACPDHHCGWMLKCHHCDALMVYHRDRQLPEGGNVRCHHCTERQRLPATCPASGHKVNVFGLGTQRVHGELEVKFPDLVAHTHRRDPDWPLIVRMDSDTMRTGRDYHETLEAFGRGDVKVLVGTQMIAKGLDYPNVRFVGVVSGDTALHMPDFRAAERTFQLIAQVAGRAGRGEQPGLVIVQSFSADDPVIELAARHDYEGFATRELAIRAEATIALPPISRMARVVVRDRDHVKCHTHARELAGHLHRFNDELQLGIVIRGPAACALSRVADYHRICIEMIAPPPQPAVRLQRLMQTLRRAHLLKSDAHTAVDVDPVSTL